MSAASSLCRPGQRVAAARLLVAAIVSVGLLLGCAQTPGSMPHVAKPVAALPPARPLEAVLPKGVEQAVAVRVEAPEFVVLDESNVFFASAATTVDAGDEQKLRAFAERLKSNRQSYVTLIGHTDDLGSRNYNLALAEQRILAVSTLLRLYGVPLRQIRRYRGDGEPIPSACKSPECRQKMRRVELVYSEK